MIEKETLQKLQPELSHTAKGVREAPSSITAPKVNGVVGHNATESR